ncbi:MAG: outer membrane protein assembly factor [Bacteroidota bacterium]
MINKSKRLQPNTSDSPLKTGTLQRRHHENNGMLLLPIAIFFLSLTSVFAQPRFSRSTVIKSISIQGNHILTTRQINDAISTKPGSPYSSETIKRDIAAISDLYNTEGYYSAAIGVTRLDISADSSDANIEFTIDEGDRSTINSIQIEGNTVFTTDEILNAFDTRAGNLLNPAVLERDIDGLVTRYEKTGYPFASVKIEKITPAAQGSSHNLDIAVAIREESRIRINEIRVSGNTETREHVIVRETGISPGDVYNPDKLVNIRKRLNRLNIFSRVEDPELYVTGDGVGGLQLRVREGNTNTFDGVLGYIPGSGVPGDNGSFSGLVNVSMRNLFGTARKFSVLWQKDDRYSQELAFKYLEPWVFDYPVDIGTSFDQRQQDTTYIRRSIELTGDLRLSDVFTVGGVFTNETVIPSATLTGAPLSGSSTTTTGVQLFFDSRDDIVSPATGVYYKNDYRIGSKKITSGAAYLAGGQLSNVVQKIALDVEFYFEPVLHQVIAMTLHGRQLTSGNIELADLYRFGGATTLRGYRENQFLGSRIAWTNTEYRFITSYRTYFFGFFDTGYYFLPADTLTGASTSQHFKYGYGIGTRFETSLGNVGVSFALGEGDTFSQGKIHVGLINEF